MGRSGLHGVAWAGSLLVSGALVGCGAGSGSGPSSRPPSSPAPASSSAGPRESSEASALAEGERALEDGAPARAVVVLNRVLSDRTVGREDRGRAYLGLGRAHEMLHDCRAAVAVYSGFVDAYPTDPERPFALARRGACEAELGRWEASAASFSAVAEVDTLLPSATVEALARQGFALFNLERDGDAAQVLARADAVFERAREDDVERFGTYYFVGMARFYRAAILHRRFRDVRLELPEAEMQAALRDKTALLAEAQDAYNHTIESKHVFWVSAAGYQLGHLISEFYDEVMYAPTPSWLDARGQAVYYDELKKQLEPVVSKATWVFEKNLETARRLGYDSPFIEMSQAKLDHLQRVVRSGQPGLGRPPTRLTRPGRVAEVGATAQGSQPSPEALEDASLFVPAPTPL